MTFDVRLVRMNCRPRRKPRPKSNHKLIYVVDPVRGERVHLSKFVKQEAFIVMSFVSIVDCFKQTILGPCDLVIYVLRPYKTEVKHLLNIRKKFKTLNFILVIPPDGADVDLAPLKENGFTNLFKASSLEKIREVTLNLLAKDGLQPRTETPHPVPIGIDIGIPETPTP